MQTTPTTCPVPSRWALDEIADECAQRVALTAAEAELRAAREALGNVEFGSPDMAGGAALDRYLLALTERNTLRAAKP